jgi:AcrR family transcriptional regulator
MPQKVTSPRTPRRKSRRSEIIATTERLLRERGLGGVTTRAIAESVPCSEGAIYVHFKDRLELLLAVLEESLPTMKVPLHALLASVGTSTPRQNLRRALTGLARFHHRVAPMMSGLVTEPELLQRFRASLAAQGKGPDRGIATLAKYIVAEQKLGRIPLERDAKAAAEAMMAGSFFHAFRGLLLGTPPGRSPERILDLLLPK